VRHGFIGVNERGESHFLAIEDGMRESRQSWRKVLLKLKSRSMNGPELVIGDGAMGFWVALRRSLSQDTPATQLDAQDDKCAQLLA
jgi:putative transposase